VHAHTVAEAVWDKLSDDAADLLFSYGVSAEPAPDRTRNPTRTITEWSAASRVNMTKTLVTLDYNTLVAQGEIAMMTLTYPDNWEALVPDGRVFKHHVDKFRQRFLKRYGRSLAGVWKMEFQRRGAPHLHMLMALPVDRLEYRLWARAAWSSIVDASGLDRMYHETQGVNVDVPDRPMTDPKRIGVYFNKHGLYGTKEYQNRAPELWIKAAAEGKSVGRFWGYWKIERVQAPALISGREAVVAARMLRRWQKQNRYMREQIVYSDLVRAGGVGPVGADGRPVVVRRRRRRSVLRPVRRMPNTAGFLAVNDGPSAAFMIEKVMRGPVPLNRAAFRAWERSL
jgi:hypothetical protein